MIRFDKLGDEPGAWEVSIAISQQFRGKGIGGMALHEACAEMEANGAARSLRAKIRRHNHPSLRLFERCGFSPEGCEGELILFARRQAIANPRKRR